MHDDPRLPDWNQGERLRKARQTANLDIDTMADHLDCTPRTIRNYESGVTRPNRATLMAWATLTDVPLWWLEADPERGVTGGYQPQLAA